MELSERLQRHVFEKTYKNAPGVKLKKILLDSEYTESEDKELEYVGKTNSIPSERLKYTTDREQLKAWVKGKVTPYLEKGHEVVLIDRLGAFVTILDVEKMLGFYYDSNPKRLCIINRSLRKLLCLEMDEEYYLLYIRDV